MRAVVRLLTLTTAGDRLMLPDARPGDAVNVERALVDAIEPWLAHMRWRSDFATWRARRIHQEDHQAERVARVRRVAGRADAAILDLGCGMGGLSVALRREEFRVWAVDFNLAYCAITRLRALRHDLTLPIARAAGEALPFADASFDAVICWDVLEHVRSLPGVLTEIRRVLRPGGAALVTATNRYSLRDQHYHLPFINWLPRRAARPVLAWAGRSKQGAAFADRQALEEMNYISWPALVRLCRSLGFAVEDTRATTLRSRSLGDLRGRRRALADLALRTRLAPALYPLYRFAVLGTFEVILRADSA